MKTDNATHLEGRQRPELSLCGIKHVRLNATDLGIYDKSDQYWLKHFTFDLPEYKKSEADLRRQAESPISGRYDTSDETSYEDLMEFALEVEHSR